MPFPHPLSFIGRLAPRLRRAAWALLAAVALPVPAAHVSPPCPPAAVMPSPEQVEAGVRQARDRGFLWRIEKDGRTSYLYGTLHVGKLEWTYPGPVLRQAVMDSDVVALEIDLQDPEMGRRMQAALATLPRPALPVPLQRRLAARLRHECLPEAVAQSLPGEVLVGFLEVMAARREGLQADYGADRVFGGLARVLHKDVRSLETPESQLQELYGRDASESVQRVEEGLRNLEGHASRDMLLRIGSLWADSRVDELQDYEAWCDCTRTALDRELLKRLLDDRNPAMAAGIDALHAAGRRVFAAVGSLHMVGPTGLPALMARRGYRVERMVFPPSRRGASASGVE